MLMLVLNASLPAPFVVSCHDEKFYSLFRQCSENRTRDDAVGVIDVILGSSAHPEWGPLCQLVPLQTPRRDRHVVVLL
ncbi:hypothetical protein F5883DRAFT_586530 [Diaporthe sp. PMI_573]|nr:hypothetical protein F5883DRAFT_586530 [Diaporthaceae sp. PMI_573]